MDPTNKPVEIELGGKKHKLIFDLNTFSAFEDVTGKFFLEFLASMRDALVSSRTSRNALDLIRRIQVKDVRALLWAALHTYDANGDPVWPYTINQLSAKIDVQSLPKLIPAILEGSAQNAPDAPKGEEAEEKERPTTSPEKTPENGGSPSGPLDEDVLSFLETKSGD